MSGIVDLNVKLQAWKMRLSQLEAESNKLKGKIAFAEEILREENEGIKIGVHETIKADDSAALSLSEAIKGLFVGADTAMTPRNIFHHLEVQGIQFQKASVYAIISKQKKKGILEAVKEGKVTKYRLRQNVYRPLPLPKITEGIFRKEQSVENKN